MKLFNVLIIIFLLCGCSDYTLERIVHPPEPPVIIPEIEVDPLSHDFGALSAGSEIHDIIVTIRNLGNGPLNIDDIYLHGGSSNFSISSLQNSSIGAYSEAELTVTYAPGTYETNSDIISILSNDEDEQEVQVILNGKGDAPVITISPDYHDFGTVYLGCDETLHVEVGNIGNSNLIISDIEYFASLPADFNLQNYEIDYGAIPIIVAPGDIVDLAVDYVPMDILDDSAYVEIASNDPATPLTSSDHDGLGDYEKWVIDNFVQDGEITVDILFVIDNSGSMYSNQSNLANNFDSFINAFGAAGADYHIAVITTDDSNFVGDVITSSTPDPIAEFNDQVDLIGMYGSGMEKGLWFSYEATLSGGDAAAGSSTGFFRETARLVVVYVSDEPDHSQSTYGPGGSLTMAPPDYSAHLLSLKSSSDLIIAHAVAGDHPSGCSTNGGAQFGDGYYDVVSDLGGAFMSICAPDWSVTMDTLASDSLATMAFFLTDNPVENTISVEVDSIPSTDWTYDVPGNLISFSVAPPDGSSIDVTYATWADCGSEDAEE